MQSVPLIFKREKTLKKATFLQMFFKLFVKKIRGSKQKDPDLV